MIFTISGFVKKFQKTSKAEKWKNRIKKSQKLHFLVKTLCRKQPLKSF